MRLKDRKVGILVEDNYQELEFWYPYLRLKEEGCQVTIIGIEKKTYLSKRGYEVDAEVTAETVKNQIFDALIIPGGYAPDLMRVSKPILELVKKNDTEGKIIAAICHAIWVPISAKIISGKKATCYYTVKDDLINAGGSYLDQSVVVDKNLITSRQPEDLPDFCRKIIENLS